jgi:hypothetical protein
MTPRPPLAFVLVTIFQAARGGFWHLSHHLSIGSGVCTCLAVPK